MDSNELLEIIQDISGATNSSVSLDTDFDQIIGWDSLCWVNLTIRLDAYIDPDRMVENIDNLHTPGDLLRLIGAK